MRVAAFRAGHWKPHMLSDGTAWAPLGIDGGLRPEDIDIEARERSGDGDW